MSASITCKRGIEEKPVRMLADKSIDIRGMLAMVASFNRCDYASFNSCDSGWLLSCCVYKPFSLYFIAFSHNIKTFLFNSITKLPVYFIGSLGKSIREFVSVLSERNDTLRHPLSLPSSFFVFNGFLEHISLQQSL